MSEIFLHRGAGTAYLRPGATEASLDAWNVPAGAISLPREMTDRLIAIRSEHATWAYETGRAGAGRGTFADALRGGSSLSMWWCSLLYERHPKVTPELYDVYRLRALEMVMEERGAGGLVTDGLTPACNAALEAMCKARGWSFAKNNEAAPEKAQSRLRRVYNRTPAPLRAIARFAWWLWSVRRVVGSCRSLPPSSAPTGTITTYFPNIDVRKAEEGVFRSRYWESLHDALQDDAGAGNTPAVRWLFVLFPSPQGSLAKCCGFRDNFRKTRKSGVSFNYLEEFLTPGGVLKSLVRYTRIAIMSAVFGKKIRSSFHFADSTLDLWPLLSGEYAESFRGWRCLERCLQQKGIENYVALSGRQRYWTFPLENCPWERMLTHAVHEAGAGTVYGAQHSTIRPTDFRYFDDPRTFSDPGTSAFQPDYVVGNGSAAVSQWADAGVPEARLRKAEALRYLYLAGSEPAPFTGTPGDLLVVTSFFRDETEAHLKLLAEALQAGLLGDPVCRFTHQRAVNALAGVREHEFRQLFRFFLVEEVAVVGLHIVFERFGDLFVHDDGLLGSADHAVVEGLGHHQVGAGAVQVRGFFNIARHVARANAQCRFTGRVSCVYHARTAGCQDGIGILHDFLGQIQRWNIDPANDIFRCASLYCCVQNDLCCCDGALFCTWMWGNDDRISGL